MTGFWARAEQERRALQAEFAAKATARMLTAGVIDPGSLTDQARRTLAWLAESDDPTVEGVADLLTAAHHSSRRAALAQRHDERAAARSDAPAAPADREASGSPSRLATSPIADQLGGPGAGPARRAVDGGDAHGGRQVDRFPDRPDAGSRAGGRPDSPGSHRVDPMVGRAALPAPEVDHSDSSPHAGDRADGRPEGAGKRPADPVANHLDTRTRRSTGRPAAGSDAASRHLVDRVADRLEALGRRADDRVVEL
jgi:hypothetical protein